MALPRLVKGTAPALAGLALLAGSTLPLPAAAQQLFCCQVQGKKVCGDRLPDQCIGKPHTVRGPGGTVRQVEGMLSPEQRAAKEVEEKRKQAEQEAQAEQKRRDSALLATYTSERDIDTARERAERDVLMAIKQTEDKIGAAEKRRRKLDNEAEFYKGKELPESVHRNQKEIDFEISTHRELITAKKKDLETIREKYETEKRRFQELMRARSAAR